MVFVVAKMRDVSVINRMKRRNICWIIESLFMQVDFFLYIFNDCGVALPLQNATAECRCFRRYFCMCLPNDSPEF